VVLNLDDNSAEHRVHGAEAFVAGGQAVGAARRPPGDSSRDFVVGWVVRVGYAASARRVRARLVLNDEIADVDLKVNSARDRAAALNGLKCADLVDAVGRVHRHRCHLLDLVSPTPARVLFGPAAVISYFPSCSAALDPQRYNFANMFYEAVGDQPEGKVLVLASNGYTNTSMGGGTQLFRLQEHGLAGVLTDGRLRDFQELAGYDFAAYCSGEATHWGGDVVTPFQTNVPVVVGGVGVVPGQYVYATLPEPLSSLTAKLTKCSTKRGRSPRKTRCTAPGSPARPPPARRRKRALSEGRLAGDG